MNNRIKRILTILACALLVVVIFALPATSQAKPAANENSYVVYLSAGGTVVKVNPDGTEILRLPKEKLGIPEGLTPKLAVNQADGTMWVYSYSGTTYYAHLSADGEEILSSWTKSSPWVKRLEVDPADSSVWSSPGYENHVYKYSTDGTQLVMLTSTAHPHWCPSVAVNPIEQTVWVTDYNAHKVMKLTSDGSEILSFTDLVNPSWVSLDQTDSSVWVADRGGGELVKLDTSGVELVRVNVGGSPSYVVANPLDGGVWVGFPECPSALKRLDSSGNVIATSPPEFCCHYYPFDIAPDGTVWATSQNKLYKLSPTGEVLLTIGGDSGTFLAAEYPSVYPKLRGGFVTGDGWLWSGQGDLNIDSESEGKATFGFVVKYKNEDAAGNLEYQYHAGNINLKSSAITWLFMSNTSAHFQGVGTINREGLYTFRVLAKDSDQAGGNPDEFTIRIWEGENTEAEPIYEVINSQLGGGNVTVHTQGKGEK